jgi:tellurite resistance protein
MTLAFVVCMTLTVAYLYKWVAHREAALEEARHPVHCCFVGLAPASGAMMGVVLEPHSHALALVALASGGSLQVVFQLWRFGEMLKGDRHISTTTPVIYLPSVAGNFIIALSAGVMNLPSLAILFFGMALFSWLSLESVLINRLLNCTPLPPALRPTLGIQPAPPLVAVLAWLAIFPDYPGPLVQACWGYGFVQILLLFRLFPWIAKQPFGASYWSFSFAVTALSNGALTMTLRGVSGTIAAVAPWTFVFTNAVMLVLIVGTIVLIAKNKLIPPPLLPVVPEAATAPLSGTSS